MPGQPRGPCPALRRPLPRSARLTRTLEYPRVAVGTAVTANARNCNDPCFPLLRSAAGRTRPGAAAVTRGDGSSTARPSPSGDGSGFVRGPLVVQYDSHAGRDGCYRVRQADCAARARERVAALAESLEAVRRSSRGHVVLVGGEAGAGKTALLRAFCDELRPSARVLWGACDPLFTPRPLGPLLDVAAAAGGELEEVVARGACRTRSSRRSPASCASGRRRSSCSRTSTGRTRPRSTFSGC